MNKQTVPFAISLLSFALLPLMAQAYIGPGVGAGALGAVIGVIGAIFLAIFAIVWYPVKRMMKGKKKPSQTDKTASK